MASENYWINDDDSKNEDRPTDCILDIIQEQCKNLYEYTNGMVVAALNEISYDTETWEHHSRESFGEVIQIDKDNNNKYFDANMFYQNKSYVFVICNDSFRFRVFELKVPPLYPIEIILDEEINNNLKNDISRIVVRLDYSNHYLIVNEDEFCKVFKMILRDKKVQYIVSQLNKPKYKGFDKNAEKIIICEGKSDEAILRAIANRLNKRVSIVVANGKYQIPRVYNLIKNNESAKILVVADSDGDELSTKELLLGMSDKNDYKYVIINNCIEDWFYQDLEGFDKYKFMYSVQSIIDSSDFEEMKTRHKSFADVLDFFEE